VRIAFVLPADRLSGGNLVVYEHGEILKSLGHEVSIVLRSWEVPVSTPGTTISPNKKYAADGAPVWYGALGYSAECLDWRSAMSRSFDLVIATWWETAFDIFSLRAEKFAYFVQSDERRFYSEDENFLRAGVELSYRLPLIFITEAGWIKQLLKDEFGQEAYLVPNGVNRERFCPTTPLEEKKSGVLRVLIEGAGAVPYKRVGLAFEAAKDIPGIEVWYVCGDGYKETSWKPDRFLGAKLPTEMAAVYSSCDVLLKLSVVEGFFLPPLEMMSCCGTAIVTDVSGHEEYVKHEENALVVKMDDLEGARRAIIRLRDDQELLNRLKKNALATAANTTWDLAKNAYQLCLPKINSESQDLGKTKEFLRFLPVIRDSMSCLQTQKMVSNGAFLTQEDAKSMLVDLDRQFKEIVGYFKHYAPKQEFETRVGAIEQVLTSMAKGRGIKRRLKSFLRPFALTAQKIR